MGETIGIIGGSGVYHLPFLSVEKEVEIQTPYGSPSATFSVAQYQDKTIVFLARHGKAHQILAHQVNYRANLFALAQLKVSAIIGIGSVGGITARGGDIMVPDQLIDYTSGRETSFDDESHPMEHIDFTYPFDETLRVSLLETAGKNDAPWIARGVYGVTNGPRLETAAEIQRMKRDGVDIVGMTAMPEAVLARALSIPYAMICPVVNDAAGINDCVEGIDLDRVATRVKEMRTSVSSILEKWLSQ